MGPRASGVAAPVPRRSFSSQLPRDASVAALISAVTAAPWHVASVGHRSSGRPGGAGPAPPVPGERHRPSGSPRPGAGARGSGASPGAGGGAPRAAGGAAGGSGFRGGFNLCGAGRAGPGARRCLGHGAGLGWAGARRAAAASRRGDERLGGHRRVRALAHRHPRHVPLQLPGGHRQVRRDGPRGVCTGGAG